MRTDFVSEVVAERTGKNPAFRKLVEEATARREMARRLTARREAAGLSQTYVAATMGTSQSVVSKLERGADVRISTLQRYCAAIGETFEVAGLARSRVATSGSVQNRGRRGAAGIASARAR